MKNIPLSLIVLSLISLVCYAPMQAQVEILKQQNLGRWGIPPANYSGIARIDSLTYAVIDDKSPLDGFYLFNISINPQNGKITSVSRSALRCAPPLNTEDSIFRSRADCEDVIYRPHSNTVFVSQEEMAEVVEYGMNGHPTGNKLKIPEFFSRTRQQHNGGFEALAYDRDSLSFWLTTENSLKADTFFADAQGKPVQMLRLMRFGDNLQANGQWLYLMDNGSRPKNALYYAHGVSAMTALPGGRLLVMERELSVPKQYIGGWCTIRVYLVRPIKELALSPHSAGKQPYGSKILPKQELFHFTTRIRAVGTNYANYEGMCLGPVLADGRQTLLLINDSQAGAGNAVYRLKDYLKVIILPRNFLLNAK